MILEAASKPLKFFDATAAEIKCRRDVCCFSKKRRRFSRRGFSGNETTLNKFLWRLHTIPAFPI
jgi:hypothetical protein